MRASIGGTLNYAALSQLYRPRDPAHLAAEIHRLHSEQHLTANDISIALRVDHTTVVNVLAKAQQPRGVGFG